MISETCLTWLGLFIIFLISLKRAGTYDLLGTQRSHFSDAHHFWYFSTLFWIAAAVRFTAICFDHWTLEEVCKWVQVIAALGMFDDILEHLFGWGLIKWVYGKFGGTV